MDKSVFKIFFSKDKETKWLNQMGQEGYILDSVSDSKYKFVKQDDVIHYSIEYLDCSPHSDEAVSYFKSREDIGVTPILASGNWVYFISKETEIECTKEICKKNSKPYFWRSLYLLFFAICGSVLCGYHMFAAGFLENIGEAGNGQLEMLSTDGNFALYNAIKSGFNYILKAINAYFRIWTDIFGKNDAVAVVSALIPIILILLVIAAFNIDSYICFKNKRKAIEKSKSDTITTTTEVFSDAE